MNSMKEYERHNNYRAILYYISKEKILQQIHVDIYLNVCFSDILSTPRALEEIKTQFLAT